MRMLFIFPDIDESNPSYRGEVSLSIGYLSAILKKHNHQVGLIHIVKEIAKNELISKIREFKPDLIGFSTISQLFPYVKTYAKWIKKEIDIPIIAGGVHPSLNPDETIGEEGIDMICIGEGELSLLELCDNIEQGKPIDDILSIWVKKDGLIKKNLIRPLVENLDILPIPDRSIFNMTKLEYMNRKYPFATIKASRGCPYNCTYCSNHRFKELYSNKNKIIRFHSVDRVIEEAKIILRETPALRSFYFHDDILPVYKEWFKEFAIKYKKEIGLPYRCKGRVELLDEETAILLKESGCFRIQFGIESGNQEILKLLGRPVETEKILKSFNICKKYNIQTHSFNMVGIPYENSSKILDTIKINARVKPDVIIISIYYPLPNTELYNICKKEGLLTGKEFVNMQSDSALALKDISPIKVKFFHRYFRTLVEIYYVLFKLPPFILKTAVNILDRLLISFTLPYSMLIYVHDKYFKNKLLDRSYFKVEDKIFASAK